MTVFKDRLSSDNYFGSGSFPDGVLRCEIPPMNNDRILIIGDLIIHVCCSTKPLVKDFFMFN